MVMISSTLTCDCRDYDIIAKLGRFTRSHWLDGVDCNLPPRLYGEKVSFTANHSTVAKCSIEGR